MQISSRIASTVFCFFMFFVCSFVFVSVALAEDVDFDQSLAQARVFVKRGYYREAVKELRRTVSTPKGERSFDAHLLLAQACFKEFDIGCSFKEADEARGLARSSDERNAAQGVLDYLNRNFGKVEFQAGPSEVTEGYLELEPLDPILDIDVKNYFKQKVAPLVDQRRSLPWIMYLPAVTYKLYGKEFTIEGGTEMIVFAGFTVENSKPKPEKAPPEEVGLTFNSALGVGVQLPIGHTAGMASQPDILVMAVPLRYGVTRMAAELHLVGGINTTSTRQVVPVFVAGLGVGGYESLGPVTLRWSAALVGGLGAVSVLCGPEAGIPEQVTLTCGLDEGFSATIKAPWFGPKVELGALWRLGPVDLGLSAAFLGEFYQLADRKRILNVSGQDGGEYEIPYRIAGGGFQVFLPALVVGPTIRWRW